MMTCFHLRECYRAVTGPVCSDSLWRDFYLIWKWDFGTDKARWGQSSGCGFILMIYRVERCSTIICELPYS